MGLNSTQMPAGRASFNFDRAALPKWLATTKNKRNEVAPVCGQLGGLFKVYSSCRSSCQNLLGSIFLSPLLRLVEKL